MVLAKWAFFNYIIFKVQNQYGIISQLYEPDIGTNTNTIEETATATATTNNGPVPSNNGDAATSNDTADEVI
ncbi:uncharacterized protein OCT59_009080 [Rhizophagus irregularis]|uniref:Uncharacterized protein n=2 Tax=Rhizophagus irregularis TaxID=588596 RepID=A0A015K1P5_RHIIW|nr:hypothetical protein RirG_039830 [Rhizophagus irregularis DAOM 197198w]UZO17739.1 hypothetical protein OCT59_009080 [Rhizophagus irregularis]GET59294.1 hypothetical protein RIR_jg793.t1 [Rhizophagus irregularis DAOM 181602=DAOM 197198]